VAHAPLFLLYVRIVFYETVDHLGWVDLRKHLDADMLTDLVSQRNVT
jgi:hypothetical protein